MKNNESILNPPNAVTVIRLLLTAPYIFSIINFDFGTAALICVIIGVSDILDGFLARRYALESRLGRFLDPVADKLTFAGGYISLAATGVKPVDFPVWLAVVLFSRDLILGLGAYYLFRRAPLVFIIKPTMLGKINSLFMWIGILLVLTANSFRLNFPGVDIYFHVLYGLMALVAAATLAHYVSIGFAMKRSV
jgi:cardiolipin synthase (CMP-forming)